jgi:hypothetical protein
MQYYEYYANKYLVKKSRIDYFDERKTITMIKKSQIYKLFSINILFHFESLLHI